MAWAFTGAAENGSNSSTTASVTHGLTINEGDLVVAFVNSNHTGAVSNDAGGSAWTNPINVQPSGQTARQALFWKKAGASEPATYTWTLNATTYYRAIVMVFTSDNDPVVDSAAAHTIDTSSSSNLICEAIDGAIISNDALSIVFGAKDNRSSSSSYTTADNSFTGVTGNRANQCAAGAYRIFTTGETFSGAVEISGATGLSDFTYSVHISFVESTGGSTYTLSADSGSYTHTGQSADLTATRNLSADSGTYTLTGQTATLAYGRVLDAQSGTYSLTGQAASLLATRTLSANSGSYTLTGQDATLTYTPASGVYTLVADSGSYVLTGQTATLAMGRKLPADSGTYTLTGQSADLSRGYNLTADSGSYALSGQDVSWLRSYVIAPENGSFTLTGVDADLTYSAIVTLQQTNWTIYSKSTPIEIVSRAKPFILYSK